MSFTTKHNGYENDTAFIPAHFQPAVLIDLCLSLEANEKTLLRGTRLTLDEVQSAKKKITPAQFFTLIGNAKKLLPSADLSFQLGQQLLPGHYGASSQALYQATNLKHAIEYFCQYYAILSPLLTPRFFENSTHAFIYWQASCDSNKFHTFLIEAFMTAFSSMSNWLAKENLPWQYSFSFNQPSHIEQYWVHLNSEPLFKQQLNMMVISKQHLNKAWPNTSPLSAKAAETASLADLEAIGYKQSFLDNVYDYLIEHIHQPICLSHLAEHFSTSPASLKRKLSKHNTHYQAQLDLARKNKALFLYQQGLSSQQVASQLRFNDMNNFRRSCKRWTGLSPKALVEQTVAAISR